MSLPDPMVPAEVNLQEFSYMPLYFRRLFASDTWNAANDTQRIAALALWCESWHQSPAGSLPDDETILARLSQTGTKWRFVRDFALRGWVRCSDGRLYHSVMAGLAIAAWNNSRMKKNQTAAAREALAKKRAELRNLAQKAKEMPNSTGVSAIHPTDTVTVSSEPSVTGTKGREGKGEGANVDKLSGNSEKAALQKAERAAARQAAERAIAYLNERAGTRFRAGDANLKFCVDRILIDGATEHELKAVVDLKMADKDFDRKYLRPETLWNKTKFAQYQGQIGLSDAMPTRAKRYIVKVDADSGDPESRRALYAFYHTGDLDPLRVAQRARISDNFVRENAKRELRSIAIEFDAGKGLVKSIFSVNELDAK